MSLNSPYIKNQGTLPACTSCAVTTAIEMILGGKQELSFLFLHYATQSLRIGNQQISVATALTAARRFGVCDERSWPSTIENARQRPSYEAYRTAKTNKLKKWLPVRGSAEYCHAIGKGHPVVMSFHLNLFREIGLGRPKASSPLHVAVAYLNEGDGFIRVRNCWGPQWNENGDFKMPISAISNSSHVISGVAIVPQL